MWNKKLGQLLLLLVSFVGSSAQKTPLTIDNLSEGWPSVSSPKISNDGKFVLYTYNEGGQQTLIVKATDLKWEKHFSGTSSQQTLLAENSQYLITKTKDTLQILSLKTGAVKSVLGASTYAVPSRGTGEWLAYQLDNKKKELVLLNLVSGKEQRYVDITAFQFSSNGKGLLLKTELTKEESRLHWLNTVTSKLTTFWRGGRAENFTIDASGAHLAFIGEDPKAKDKHVVWYYTSGMNEAEVIVDNRSQGIEEGLTIKNELPKFNNSGNRVFFYLEHFTKTQKKLEGASVDIWSYHDARLMAQQLKEKDHSQYIKYLTVLDFKNPGRVVRLEKEYEEVVTPVENLKGNYALLHYRKGDDEESHWNQQALLSIYLVDIRDGSRKPMKVNIPFWSGFFSLSPDEKFVLNFDSQEKNYFSYEIITGIKRNISKAIPVPLNIDHNQNPESKFYPYGQVTWLKDDKGLIIYDEYDLWQVDPLGVKSPVNLTNGFGRENKIEFRLVYEEDVLDNKKPLLLTFVDKQNLKNGFYQVNVKKVKDPVLLSECDCILYSNNLQVYSLKPIKAKQADYFLLSKKDATKHINFLVTKDFKSYMQISHVPSPSTRFNWFTTELVNWKTYENLESKGILYKPDNFDARKKYPVIFYFYEKLANKLNEFIEPDFSYSDLPIPYFVSNGYLVFTPDIHYTIGYPGQSAYNSVVSAAEHLAKLPFVDATKMGIMGHSFGGYEVNYLISHTNKFAAAVSAAGLSNIISYYGSAYRFGYSIAWAERGQGRIGTDVWSNPNLYISNSPIFNVDKINTPLLIMNNKLDRSVPFAQGVELFTALRRLGKKSWMLQYDNGGHSLYDEKDAKDFTIRLKQFFDHYLKGAPAPTWMTRGIPAKLKGVEDGLNLNQEILTPGKGVTTNY